MKTCKVLLLLIAGLLFAANIYCDDENASSDKEDTEGSVCPLGEWKNNDQMMGVDVLEKNLDLLLISFSAECECMIPRTVSRKQRLPKM